jgi:shikimate kinase
VTIALIGYRGTGKSTVGCLLAKRLGRRFIDTDRLIESNRGQTIASIFAEGGEKLFRNCETEALASLEGHAEPLIIAGGGGLPLREENRKILCRLAPGRIVLLTASPEVIAQRMTGDAQSAETRPPLTKLSFYDEIKTVLEQRYPIYLALADHTIVTEKKTPEKIVEEILSLL